MKIPKQLTDSRVLDKIESKEARHERKAKQRTERERERELNAVREGIRKKRKPNLPDYLDKKQTTARRRIDPLVSLNTILEDILNEIRDLKDCEPFRYFDLYCFLRTTTLNRKLRIKLPTIVTAIYQAPK